MARGHSRSRSEVQGITVRSVENEPVRADVAGYFRKTPDGSLGELYGRGDTLELYDNGRAVPVRLEQVKDRSLVARLTLPDGSLGGITRLVTEKDAQGNVVGLKEAGKNGRRVA
jgi:hypothetical protein